MNDQTRTRIDEIVGQNRIVLFMKGTRTQPQCGFSAATIGILDSLATDYTTVNVLDEPEIRDGIKSYSNWPTIPQLYVDGEFMGGCDITKQMFNSGELHEVLGVPAPDRTPPEIQVSDAAAEIIRGALASNPGVEVHLSIDSRWQHSFGLAPAEGHELTARSNDISILMDVASAQKARGLKVDAEDTLQGKAFKIENPNAPAPVEELSVTELKQRMDAGEPVYLVDVRPLDERQKASIPGSKNLDGDGRTDLEGLSKDAFIVFYCHTGQRSRAAAEHFRIQGFAQVRNLTGGVDAWSSEVDPSVPRY